MEMKVKTHQNIYGLWFAHYETDSNDVGCLTQIEAIAALKSLGTPTEQTGNMPTTPCAKDGCVWYLSNNCTGCRGFELYQQ